VKTRTRILIALWVCLACWFIAATPTPVPTRAPFTISDAELEKLTDADIAKMEAHKQQLEGEVLTSINKVGDTAVEQGASLADAAQATSQARLAFAQYKKETQDQIAKGNAAILKYAKKAAKLRTVGYVGNAFILIIAAFIALKVPAFGIYVGGGIAVVASIAWWAWILL
jgi:hypothetical protein